MPHPTSKHHSQMTLIDRAAQFSPFAALTGHNEVISETARLTDKRIILDEDKIAELNRKLQIIAERITELPEIKMTFFKKDVLKDGGAYIKIAGRVKRIDKHKQVLVVTDGTEIDFKDIIEIL